jgi:hypothetical protein
MPSTSDAKRRDASTQRSSVFRDATFARHHPQAHVINRRYRGRQSCLTVPFQEAPLSFRLRRRRCSALQHCRSPPVALHRHPTGRAHDGGSRFMDIRDRESACIMIDVAPRYDRRPRSSLYSLDLGRRGRQWRHRRTIKKIAGDISFDPTPDKLVAPASAHRRRPRAASTGWCDHQEYGVPGFRDRRRGFAAPS